MNAKKNCLYNVAGCDYPVGCNKCGFDRKEAERRKNLPLAKGKDGLSRKILKRL